MDNQVTLWCVGCPVTGQNVLVPVGAGSALQVIAPVVVVALLVQHNAFTSPVLGAVLGVRVVDTGGAIVTQ